MARRSSRWIQKAIKRPGALHRALGIPEDKEIPVSTLRKLAAYKGKDKQKLRLKRMAILAMTLAKLRKRKKRR